MNSLVAKIEKDEYKNVLSSSDTIIKKLDIENVQAEKFEPAYKLEENEWFKLCDFSKREYFLDICKADYSTAILNQIDNNDYNQVSYIVIFQNNQKHFQRITPSRFVDKKCFIDFSGEPKILNQPKLLEIKPESDAIYINNNDTIYFKDIKKIKPIFPGIEILAREATQEEVNTFLSNDFITLMPHYKAGSVGVQNRERIANIGAKYQKLSEEKQKLIIDYAKEKSGINITNSDAFEISSETDLKNLLYALDQRYYYADIYEENRLANSYRKVAK